METAFAGLECRNCTQTFDEDTVTHRCPACDRTVEPIYDSLEDAHSRLFSGGKPDRKSGLARFESVLPFPAETLITIGEGQTPLIDCPDVATDLGVTDVFLKAEGQNGTGGIADRGMAVAIAAARQHGAEAVALPTAGNSGQATAAYAARAGLDSHSFVPSRTTFTNKAMINVHGGDMNVVGGRYPDAYTAFTDALAEQSWHSLAPFAEPYRHEGIKTVAYELVDTLGTAPDAVVVPTGETLSIAGIEKGFRELFETGTIEQRPALYATQPAGCAPVVNGHENGMNAPEPVEHPDTICGELEIPDPSCDELVFDALADSGGCVSVSDEELLEQAVSLASRGVPVSAAGGAAVSGARALAREGSFEEDETVVVIDPATPNRDADILRSHLMKQGI